LFDPCAFTFRTSDFCLLILRNGQIKGELLIAFHTFEIVAGHSRPPGANISQETDNIFFFTFVNILKNQLEHLLFDVLSPLPYVVLFTNPKSHSFIEGSCLIKALKGP